MNEFRTILHELVGQNENVSTPIWIFASYQSVLCSVLGKEFKGWRLIDGTEIVLHLIPGAPSPRVELGAEAVRMLDPNIDLSFNCLSFAFSDGSSWIDGIALQDLVNFECGVGLVECELASAEFFIMHYGNDIGHAGKVGGCIFRSKLGCRAVGEHNSVEDLQGLPGYARYTEVKFLRRKEP